jgi:PAS domain S-box-containing protein
MDRSEKILHTNRRSFVKAYWLFGVVLAILTVFVAYLLVRVYRASSLLAEASRQSFAQEAKTRVSILNEYFERLSSGVETLSNSRALHAYYQNKALGMSLEYGLAVAVAQVRDEFEHYQRTVLAQGRPVSQQITFFDTQEMRVIAETQPLSNAHSIDAKQLEKVLVDSEKSHVFGVTETDSEWAVFVVRSVSYKADVRGYLLMKLDLKTLQAQIQIEKPQKNDAFDGIADSRGILLVGPQEFLGKNISEFLGVSPQSLGEFHVIDIHDHRLGGVSESLIVSGGQVPHVPFYLVSVAPTSQYLAGYSASLWGMIFTGLMTCLVIMVIFISKSLLEQSKMYGQLEEARDSLEIRVRKRTSELGETNLRLQGEIKERSRIEESLRESEARYRGLFEYASDLIYTLDLEGNFISVNGIVRSLLGYTADEFLTLHFRDILDPQSLQTTEENFLRKVRDGLETTGPYEILVRTKDGTFVWLEVTSRIIRQERNPVGIHGIARNITQRKELEAAVHEAQMKYQSLVEAFDGVIHISSPNYEIEFANQRLIDRTGYDPVGKKCYEVLHGLNEVCPWCKYGKVPREETFRRERFSPKDNRWYYVVSSPMVHQDGSMSRIFLMQDIDELKRSEEERENLSQQLIQAQKMEAVGTLAGGIAHDFNNLLQVVLGYSQLLLAKKSPNSPEYDNVKKITVAARHAADLVKGLLAFSRKAITRPRPLDLNYQVTEVGSLLERTIPKMIKIDLRLEQDLPVIHADPGQIEQILMNLGVNARDAMLDGGVLTIETSNVLLDQDYTRNHIGAKPGRHVMLLVSDTGQGIDKETLEHIFEPFYTTKDVGKGTGLGLSMVYGIVKQHDGYISCESQPGHGTTFRIYFPAVEKEQEEHEQVDVSSPPGGFETLLMVDDEEVVRELGSDYLRQAGYTVLTASNGREALEVYQEKQADVCLVLLDLIMPEMGGRKCFKELLQINPNVKVLIVSGYTSGGTEKDAVELGARGFVEKPYDLTKLLQTIRDVLDAD